MDATMVPKSTKKLHKGKRAKGNPANQASTSATATSALSGEPMVQPRRSFWQSFSKIFKCSAKRRHGPVDAHVPEGPSLTTVQQMQQVQAAPNVPKDTESVHDAIQDMKTMLMKYSISPRAISMVQRVELNRMTSALSDVSDTAVEDESELQKVLLKNRINTERLHAIAEESETKPADVNGDLLGARSASALTVDKDTDSFEYSESESMVDVAEEKGDKVMFSNSVTAKDENNVITVDYLNEETQEVREDSLEKIPADGPGETKEMEGLAGVPAQYSVERQLTLDAADGEAEPSRDAVPHAPVDAMKIFGAKIMDNQGSNLLRHLHDMHAAQQRPETDPNSSTSLEHALAKAPALDVPLVAPADSDRERARPLAGPQSPSVCDGSEESTDDTTTDTTASSESLDELEVWSKPLSLHVHGLPLSTGRPVEERAARTEAGKEVRLNNLFSMAVDPGSCACTVHYVPVYQGDQPVEMSHPGPFLRMRTFVPRKQKLMSLLENVHASEPNEADPDTGEESDGQDGDDAVSASSWTTTSISANVSCSTLYHNARRLDSCSSSSTVEDTRHFVAKCTQPHQTPVVACHGQDVTTASDSRTDSGFKTVFRSSNRDVSSMMCELLSDVAELKQQCLRQGVQADEEASVVFRRICEGDRTDPVPETDGGTWNRPNVGDDNYDAGHWTEDADKLRIFKTIDEDLEHMIQALIDVEKRPEISRGACPANISAEVVEEVLDKVFTSTDINLAGQLDEKTINEDMMREETEIRNYAKTTERSDVIASFHEPKEVSSTRDKPACDYHVFFNNSFSLKTGLVGPLPILPDDTCSQCSTPVAAELANKRECGSTRDMDAVKEKAENIQETILETLATINNEISKSLQEICEHSSTEIFQLEHKLSETDFVAPKGTRVLSETEANINVFQENMQKLVAVNRKTAEILRSTCGLVSGIASLTDNPGCSHGLTLTDTVLEAKQDVSTSSESDSLPKAGQRVQEIEQKATEPGDDRVRKYQHSLKTNQQLSEANQNLTENLEKILSEFSEQFSKCVE